VACLQIAKLIRLEMIYIYIDISMSNIYISAEVVDYNIKLQI
jgi:hypothetical protein